jgi:predicted dehydrogenase
LLGETAQTLWRALRGGEIGRVRVVYAELDDGPVHLQEPHLYRSASGAPFPYRDEFEVGCTVEHAAYYLTWFTAFFGPAATVTSFSTRLWPDRQVTAEETLNVSAPDFSVGCITFRSGVVVRLTCSSVAPYDHGMQIVGDRGLLRVDECWNYSAPVRLEKYSKRWFRARSSPGARAFPLLEWMRTGSREYPPLMKVSRQKRYRQHRQDFARGIADLAQAAVEGRPPRLPADYCLHVNELVLAIQNAGEVPYRVTSTFEPLEPMDDAALNELASISW